MSRDISIVELRDKLETIKIGSLDATNQRALEAIADKLLDHIAALEAALEPGTQLANVAYNICQRGNADAGALRSLNAAQIQWDETRAARLASKGRTG